MQANARINPAFQPGTPPEGVTLAIKAWNMMGGIDWQAIPILAELLGIQDVELWLRHLTSIRDFQRDHGSG